MTRKHSIALALIVAVLVGGAWVFPYVRSLWPALGPKAPIPSSSSSPSSGPLQAPVGWKTSLLTDKVPGARDMVLDQFGNIWVSQTSEGTVSLIYLKDTPTGEQPLVSPVFRDLRKPHGLAFDPQFPGMLYVAEETHIFRVPTYSDGNTEFVASLPEGGRHFTRSLAFDGDGRLLVSIGSTCDVCYEKNPEHAAVISMKRDGSDRKVVATGLRNSVFLTRNPRTGDVWGTDMGRDFLGDMLPPDEVNVITSGANYGWPICYGAQINDRNFDKKVYIRDPCADTVVPRVQLPAHTAPLGLAFIPAGWPANYQGDLLVALHGSWNSSVPVGYKVVRVHLDQQGRETSIDDFLTGFIKGNQAIGRPVDILPMSDGTLYVSDDKAGAIWKVERTN